MFIVSAKVTSPPKRVGEVTFAPDAGPAGHFQPTSRPAPPLSAALLARGLSHALRPRRLHRHSSVHHTSPASLKRPSRLFNLTRHACFWRTAKSVYRHWLV